RAALRAWAGSPDPVPAEAAGPVCVMLDALARLERFDAFEALAAVLARMPLGARDRHERLAALYLRRGFLESAAEEWITVCETLGPDAAAVRGLAAVAEARGLPEDAAVLRAEADTLDPARLVRTASP
ncbi:MAG: glycosyltransferase, partial [Solirubrobacterales bacterium]|nr:glycosyltransferase [Solirubrobacterales bacterium]